MGLLAKLRHRRRYVRSVFAAFVLAWVQLAAAPCLMAADPGEPHLAASGSSTETHHSPKGAVPDPVTAAGHCGYCPSEASTADPSSDAASCGAEPATCAYPDDPTVDVRDARQIQLEKLATHAALLDPSAFGLLRVLRNPDDEPPPAAQPVRRRSLNLENCVQLR